MSSPFLYPVQAVIERLPLSFAQGEQERYCYHSHCSINHPIRQDCVETPHEKDIYKYIHTFALGGLIVLNVRRMFIKKGVDALTNRNKVLNHDAVLMNTIVSAETAINHMVWLKEHIKMNYITLSINKMLILGAEFETVSDYINAIKQELDL